MLLSGRCLVCQLTGVYLISGVFCLLTVLTICNLPDFTLAHQITETDIAQELVNLIREIGPQMMSETLFAILAVALVPTPRGVQRFTDGVHHFGDIHIVSGST